MPARTVFSAAAQRDMAAIADWLRQPGSGYRAHRKLDDIRDGIDTPPERYAQHATNPDKPGWRLAIIHEYAVRFRRRVDGSIFILRVFGPGQLRKR